MNRAAILVFAALLATAAVAQDAPDPDSDTAIERSGAAGAAYEAFLAGRYEEAIAIWLPMANSGDSSAQFNLGVMYANGLGVDRNMQTAMDWWTRAAAQLHVRAAHDLALAILAGEPVLNDHRAEPDYPAVLRYLKIGADAGYPNSEYTLAKLYAEGIGVEKDEGRAAELFLSAGIKGFAKAQYNLGKIYRDGRGMPQDDEMSLFWFTQAAQRGHARAEDKLGARCLTGQGVPKDEVEALKWSILAAQQGVAEAERRRFDLAASLPQNQIAEAEARAAAFAPKKGPVLDLAQGSEVTRRVSIRRETWPLAKPFAISRGSKTAAEVVVCEIEADGAVGRGECVPYARYGETVASVEAVLHGIGGTLAAGLTLAELQTLLPPGAARNAADCALWDLRAKQSGEPVWRLAGLAAPTPLVTAYTISLGSPDAMAADAADAHKRPLLKLKLDGKDPLSCVAAVRRAAPDARLIADANEGWSVAQLKEIAPDLAAMGVELVEQPVPAADDSGLEGWASPIILCADESFHVSTDIAALGGRYGAVNVKLDKSGGFTEALRCLAAARAHHLQIMVGCMVATSLAMAPAALLAASAHYVDLDGPLLLAKDRPGGIEFAPGSIMKVSPEGFWG